MRWCVLGAGAVGTYVAARLADAGETVELLARGTALSAIAARGGVTVRDERGEWHADLRALAQGTGPADVIVLAVKAHQIAAALPALATVTGPATVILTLQNGIPWWYGYGHRVAAGWTLETVDPGGTIAAHLDPARVVGGIVYFHANLPGPGIVAQANGMRLVIGEPADGITPRVEAIAAVLRDAGFAVDVAERLRPEIWSKLLGNVNLNPISALTGAYVREIVADPATHALVRETMYEALAVAAALGDAPQVSIDARIAVSPLDGDVRTSMLQDREAGRPMEIDPIVGAVLELGRHAGVATPAIGRLYALTKLLDRSTVRGVGRSEGLRDELERDVISVQVDG